MSGAHEIFHVVALVSFLGAMGVAFIGVAAPVLFGANEDRSVPRLRTSLLLAAAAMAGLAADWAMHKLLA